MANHLENPQFHLQDFPDKDPNTLESSSIGGLWPPEPASHQRQKAFFNSILTSQNTPEFLSVFESAINTMSPQAHTRVQFRALTSLTYLDQLLQQHPNLPVEAFFQLDSSKFALDPVLVYFSTNHSSRQTSEGNLKHAIDNFNIAQQYSPRPKDQLVGKALSAGFHINSFEKFSDIHSTAREQLVTLYRRFDRTSEEVDQIIADPNTIIAVTHRDGQIISAGLAELAQVPIGSHYLNLAEITEAATVNAHQNGGLYTAVSTHLLQLLSHRSRSRELFGGQEVDVVFGECNSLSPGVLVVSQIQGREFALNTARRLKLPVDGVLSQQVPIQADLNSDTGLNDLFPTYLTRSRLYELF